MTDLRPEHELGLGQRADRHHRAGGVAHIDAIDVVDRVAEAVLRLDVDLPGAAEQVEVVDVEAAEGGLQGVEHVAHLDAQHLRLVAVDVEKDLRRVGGEGAEDAGELGLLVGGHDQAARDGGEIGRRLALQGLQHVLEAAGAAEPEDRRQVEGKDDGALDRGELGPQAGDDGVDLLAAVGALLVGLQAHDEEGLLDDTT